MDISLYNTLSRKKEVFKPIEAGQVRMYNCGPTLYDRQHIGNLSMFVFTDVLRRTLEYAKFDVKQVINFTDFGHLSGDNMGDADQGEDRMTKGLKREGLEPTLANMRVLAEKYAKFFLDDLKSLNVKTEEITFPFASDYIDEQIEMIKTLEEKGFTYTGKGGVYFDTSKFPDYGELGNIDLAGLKEGARVAGDSDKKNPTDFLLWKSSATNKGWQSPRGVGFPGWHIECSAMIFKILGERIDIHTGGIEHIAIHHNNEIAQAEAASGKSPFSRFWLHREHLKIENTKISKSLGNVVYIDDLTKKGVHPLSLRYLLLSSHYKTPANFTDEAVEASQNALERIVIAYGEMKEKDSSDKEIIKNFEEAIGDDLNTPIALSILGSAKSKRQVEAIDEVLGLNIKELSKAIQNIPDEILDLKKERDGARSSKDWQRSDKLRSEIEQEGFVIEDQESGSKIRRTFASLVGKRG